MDSNWTATAKTCLRWFVTIKVQTRLRIRVVSSATLLSAFLDESYLHLLREKFQFLASLFSRRDWFKTRIAGNPEDRFSSVVACVACSTVLGHILQVQQIMILRRIMRRLFIRYINGSHIIWLRSASSNTQVIRWLRPTEPGNGGDFDFLAAGPCTNSANARLERGYKGWCAFFSPLCTSHLWPRTSLEECRV